MKSLYCPITTQLVLVNLALNCYELYLLEIMYSNKITHCGWDQNVKCEETCRARIHAQCHGVPKTIVQ